MANNARNFMNQLSIRLSICMNDAPIGPRLHRTKPFPSYQYTYCDTPEGRSLAEHDMERVRAYLADYEADKKGKKR
jgi:hypothetical protein